MSDTTPQDRPAWTTEDLAPLPDSVWIYDNRPMKPPGWRYGMPVPPEPRPWWRRMRRHRDSEG